MPVFAYGLLLFAVLGTVVACGGGQAKAGAPRGGGSGAEDGDFSSSGAEANERRARRGLCPDDECAECGEGICPSGYFCDEGLVEPACEWLPSCAQNPTCDCVTAALGSDCDCEERGEGVYVDCG